jgi:hypothetical protein
MTSPPEFECGVCGLVATNPNYFVIRCGDSALNLYRSEFALLQFIDGAGTAALSSCCLQHVFGLRFSVGSINLGIRFYGVETGDIGDSIEPEESQ